MPRVAVLFEYPSLNGGEWSILTAAERLKSAYEFVAFAPIDGPLGGALHGRGWNVLQSPLLGQRGERLPRAAGLERLVAAVERTGADLLHGNSLAMGRLTGAAAPRLSAPCTAHLRDIVGLSDSAVADLNRNARLIAVSEATRAFHIGQEVDPQKVFSIHNGVDTARFQPRPRDARIRAQLGIPPGALVLLTVGQIGLRKGWDVLADAVASIAERFPDLHVILAGARYSEKEETIAYERSVRNRFAEVIGRRARFVGYRDDMPELMNAADVLVHPARQEPFGRVLLEAAASGLPIVATTVGGTAEMLEDGASAVLVPAGDAEALAEALASILTDAALRSRLGGAARRAVEERFGADKSAQILAKVWEAVLSEAR